MRVGFRQKVFSRNSRQHTRPPMYFRKLSLVEPSSSCGLGLAAFTVDRWRFHTHTRPARSGAQNVITRLSRDRIALHKSVDFINVLAPLSNSIGNIDPYN
jgi:hypothetical protein